MRAHSTDCIRHAECESYPIFEDLPRQFQRQKIRLYILKPWQFFHFNRSRTYSRIFLKSTTCERMLYINYIAWQRRKFEKFVHSNFPVEARWFSEIAGLAVLIPQIEKYTLHRKCLEPNRPWSASFFERDGLGKVRVFSPQKVVSIYPRLPRKYFYFWTRDLA